MEEAGCNLNFIKIKVPVQGVAALKYHRMYMKRNIRLANSQFYVESQEPRYTLRKLGSPAVTLCPNPSNGCKSYIGHWDSMALHPMLVRTLDGMDVTILEAGQYYNAVVTNDLLLTWRLQPIAAVTIFLYSLVFLNALHSLYLIATCVSVEWLSRQMGSPCLNWLKEL
ncbi:hypothetical protein GQX74_014272 [Glossina fuscipes]|nr:hypothetical protein GQX74_014272 [Glossina fuscipes]